MTNNTQTQISLSEACADLSKLTRIVDEKGSAVILKNDVPRYIIMEYSAVEELTTASDEYVDAISQKLIQKNLEAYKELAK